MSLAELIDWLHAHPGTRIVTDIKEGNLLALEKIAEEYPRMVERILPQVYFFEEYKPVWDMGYRNIILTLYMMNCSDESVLAFAQGRKLFGITMWVERAMGRLPRELGKMKIPVFAHTVNTLAEQRKLEANGVSGFYTDYLCGEK